jgi:hypothetical protein
MFQTREKALVGTVEVMEDRGRGHTVIGHQVKYEAENRLTAVAFGAERSW